MLFINFNLTRVALRLVAVGALSVAGVGEALALPSFARQTGESCDSCHVGAYGPQLTPHGMKFKIGGYTESDGKDGHVPLAAMVVGTFTQTKKAQIPAPNHFDENNNTVMQELSGFLGGKLYKNVGAFAQATYSGVEEKTALDNVDLRYATETTLLGQQGIFGVSLNNSPTVQDPFNTLPAWRFPYVSSDAAPAMEGETLFDTLAGTVGGATAYAFLSNGFYAEIGDYQSPWHSAMKKVNIDAEKKITGAAPYGRVAYFQDVRRYSYSAGIVGISASLRDFGATGPSDKYSDFGVDGHYQFLGTRKHIYSVNGSYIRESRTLDTAEPAMSQKLNALNLTGSYYFDKTYGATVHYFNTSSDESDLESSGVTMQADWTPFGKEASWHAPWANVRVGLQYTMYNKLNGDSDNASDSNTLVGFVWASL